MDLRAIFRRLIRLALYIYIYYSSGIIVYYRWAVIPLLPPSRYIFLYGCCRCFLFSTYSRLLIPISFSSLCLLGIIYIIVWKYQEKHRTWWPLYKSELIFSWLIWPKISSNIVSQRRETIIGGKLLTTGKNLFDVDQYTDTSNSRWSQWNYKKFPSSKMHRRTKFLNFLKWASASISLIFKWSKKKIYLPNLWKKVIKINYSIPSPT